MCKCFMIHLLVTLFSVAFAFVMGLSFGKITAVLEEKEKRNE